MVFSELEWHGVVVLALTAAAIFLFSRDRIPLETSSLCILVALVLLFAFFPYEGEGGTLAPTEFFVGFGHEALVSICALMIMGRALERTGALQPLASAMARLWPRYPKSALLLTLVLGAVLSAFVNNTPIVVMLLPMLVAVGLRNEMSTSGILLPMGLATIVGGMSTTIGTSTNLLVVSLASDMGLRDFGMFDFALPVLMAGSVGILFLWVLAPRLIPERTPPLSDTSPRLFAGKICINEESAAADKSIAEVLALTSRQMRIIEVQRRDGLALMRLPTTKLRPGDTLLVRDTPDNLKSFEQEIGGTLQRDDEGNPGDDEAGSQKLAEISVTSGSLLDNRTLAGVNFEARFGLTPVALHQPGTASTPTEFDKQRLSAGDVILVQGTQESLGRMKASGELLVLDGAVDLPVHRKARVALAVMIAVVGLAAVGVVPISVAATTGVLAMLLTRCLKWNDVGDALVIPVIMIIVASLALGSALIATGGAEFLAGLFLWAASDLSLVLVLAAVMALLAVATNVISNNAAAIIGTPVAVDIANSLGTSVEPFLLAVIFGANMSFATPVGYKTNLLVMTAGGYRFSDFVRVGLPLTLLMTSLLTGILWFRYDLAG